jgi:hypothetical protein
VLDSAYSPSTSTAEAEIQQWRLNFQRKVRIIQKRAHEDYAATERDANKARRVNEDYAATERDANKARRANANYSATKRDADKAWRSASTRTMRPQNAMQMKSGEPTRNLSGARGSNTAIYYLGCGQAQLSALFCCLDYAIKPPCELEISLYLAAAARSHIEQSVGC